MCNYSEALEYYEKAHKIYENSLPPTHPHLATFYSNIALVYNNMDDYLKSIEYYEKELEIMKKALPPTHPDLATSYLNFAACSEKMDDYTAVFNALQNSGGASVFLYAGSQL